MASASPKASGKAASTPSESIDGSANALERTNTTYVVFEPLEQRALDTWAEAPVSSNFSNGRVRCGDPYKIELSVRNTLNGFRGLP